MKILLIDDNHKLLKEMKRYLIPFSSVDTISDVDIALSMIEHAIVINEPYKLIYTDLKVCNSSCFDMLDKLKKLEKLYSLETPHKIILSSEKFYKKAYRDWFVEECNDFLIKPFGCKELKEKIKNLV